MNNLGTSNMTNENLLLIIILNEMYNDNNRQIQNLTHHNNEILNILTNMLNRNTNANNRNTNTNNRNTNTNTNNRNQYNRNQYNRNRNTNVNNTNSRRNNTNNNRDFLNNAPYIIDNIHAQTIPRTYLPILSENNPAQQRTNTSEMLNMFTNFFDPIVIHPTLSQIETATRRVRYCDIVSPINRSCPISLENFTDNDMVTVIRFCGHIFNTEHLNTWFQNNCRCPICRYDIRNYNSSMNDSSFYNGTNNLVNNQQTTNNSSQNNSSETNEERNNITRNQSIFNLFNDISGNLIFDSSDPQIILNLFNSLTRR
jgi:hypothetical protein